MLFLEKLEQKRIYIILVTLICILVSTIYASFLMPKKVTSSTSLLLVKVEENNDKELENNGNIELTSNFIATLEELIKNDTTAQELSNKLNINITSDNIFLNRVSDSDTFEIKIKLTNINDALKANKEIVKIFSNKIENMYKNTDTYIVDDTHIISTSNISEIILYAFLGLILGLFINAIYILILMQFEKKIKNDTDIENDFSLKTLIAVPMKNIKSKSNVEIISSEIEKTSTNTSFKQLRSNIQFVNVNNKAKNIILITSPFGKEGKSYISANLAVSYANVGKKVILIDADLNNGRQNKIFNIPNNIGLSNFLSNLDTNGVEINERINKYINETQIKNLNVITSGTVPPNSSELLSSSKLPEMLKDLSVFYDVVILDGTSTLNKIDSLILTRNATSTIIVTLVNRTKKDDLWKTKRDLQNVGGRIIGIIVNRVKVKSENKNDNKVKVKNKFIENIKSKINKIKEKIKENEKQKLLEEAKNKENVIDLKNNINENKILDKADEKQKETTVEKNENVINNENKIDERKLIIAEKIKDFERKTAIEKHLEEEKREENIQNNTATVIVDNDKKENEEIPIIDLTQEDTKDNENDENINLKNNKETKIDYKLIINNLKVGTAKAIKTLKRKAKKLKIKSIKNYRKINKSIKAKKEAKLEKKRLEFEQRNEELNKIKENIIQINNSKPAESQDYTQTQNKLDDQNHSTNKIKTLDELENETFEGMKIEKKQKVIEDESIKNEKKTKNDNIVLVVVDAVNEVCRAFTRECYTEKAVRGLDKTDGFVKANYSSYLLRKRVEALMLMYNITKSQASRIDPLVYSTLSDYDDCVWIQKKVTSNKAEAYVLEMAKDYPRQKGESRRDYVRRYKMQRKMALYNQEIEIDYNIDLLWKGSKMKFVDKIAMQKFARIYGSTNKQEDVEKYVLEDEEGKFEEEDLEQISYDKKKNNFAKIKNITKMHQVKAKSVQELTQEVDNELTNKNIPTNNFSEVEINEQNNVIDFELQKQERKKEIEILRKIQKEKNDKRKRELKEQKEKKREEKLRVRNELKRAKELEREKKLEEARIEEELLGDNLYPKTKNNKNLF